MNMDMNTEAKNSEYVDLWNLDNFIKFLESKPPTETYDYTDPKGCAVYQYIKASGVAVYDVGTAYGWCPSNGLDNLPLPHTFDAINKGRAASECTFGAALKRAKAARARAEAARASGAAISFGDPVAL